MVRIGIISRNAAYGNAAALAEGMRHFADVSVWFHEPDKKGFYKQTKVVKSFPDCDRYVILGAVSIGFLPAKYRNRKVTIVLTDSTYMNRPELYNKFFKDNGWTVFAMPDLAPLSGTKNIYYQPFIMPQVDRRKTEMICHSPFCESKEKQKGTVLISAICAKNNLPLTIIKGKTWRETIEIKARHLICVDQLFRGIGKSGLEAMLLDSIVLSGVKPEGNHLPPILWTDKKRFENDLLDLIFDKKKQGEIIQRQRAWARENLDPEVMAKKIYES